MKVIKNQMAKKVIFVMMGLIMVILLFKFMPQIIKLTVSMDAFRSYILSQGKLGPLSFVLFQVLQTVIAPVPGEVVQIAGGYIYGVTLGTLYNTIGLLLGAMIAFYFTRYLGGAFVEKLLTKKKFLWIGNILNSKKASIFLFIIFVIPGLPKDLFIYAAALTKIRPLKFFSILIVARFPWLLASVSVGANMYQKNYVSTIIISVVALLAFVLGIIYKDKLMNKLLQFNEDKNKS